jgi:hypothetical protein
LRFIKASFVILSALFSSLVILWMGAQTRPVHGSWSFSPFWDSLPFALVASSAMLGAGTRFAIASKQWSVALTLIASLGVCAAFRMWTWPSLALVLPGTFASFILGAYPRAWRWIAAVGILLAAYWFGVATYCFYEQTGRGGESITLLFVALFLTAGSSAIVILQVVRSSGGSGPGVRDGVSD